MFFSRYRKGNRASRRDMRKAAVKGNREVVFPNPLVDGTKCHRLISKEGRSRGC